MSCPSPNDQGLERCSVLFAFFWYFVRLSVCGKKSHIYMFIRCIMTWSLTTGFVSFLAYCNRIFTTFVHIKLLVPLSQVSATCTRTNPNPGLGLKFLLPNLVQNVKNRQKSWTCQSQLVCFNSFFYLFLHNTCSDTYLLR